MSYLTILKFPLYYTKKDIDKINKIKPDILLLDDNFITSLDEFDLPDSILYIDFGEKFNKSLKYFKFPKHLKKIKFGKNFSQTLDNVVLPNNLEVIEFGSNYTSSLFCVQFPKSLKEIILNNEYNSSLPFFLPKKIEKIMLGKYYDYSVNTFVVPKNLKYLRINGNLCNKVLLDNLPKNLKTLEIVYNLAFDMSNLPNSLEELIINFSIPKYGNNIMGTQFFNNVNIQNLIVKQTNIPCHLKKIKLLDVNLIEYIKKIPYECEIVDMNDDPYIL